MCSDAALNMGHVSINASNYTNMFSIGYKGDGESINLNRRDCLLVVDSGSVAGSRKNKKFGLLWGKSHMMFLAIIKSECKEMVEKKNIMGEKENIISLANGGNLDRANINAKIGLMGRCQLFRIVDCVKISRRDPSLLKS